MPETVSFPVIPVNKILRENMGRNFLLLIKWINFLLGHDLPRYPNRSDFSYCMERHNCFMMILCHYMMIPSLLSYYMMILCHYMMILSILCYNMCIWWYFVNIWWYFVIIWWYFVITWWYFVIIWWYFVILYWYFL